MNDDECEELWGMELSQQWILIDYCLALGVVVMSLEMELNAVSQTAANRPMVFTIFTV